MPWKVGRVGDVDRGKRQGRGLDIRVISSGLVYGPPGRRSIPLPSRLDDDGGTMDRAELLERYGTGAAAVDDALAGVTEAELDRRPPSGEWTAREITHHLADSETMAYIRLRRLIAEDDPVIAGYDEPEWARRLHYDRPIEPSLAVLRAVRAASLALLQRADARRVAADRDAFGIRAVLGRRLADDLREPLARARRPDPARATRRGLTRDR